MCVSMCWAEEINARRLKDAAMDTIYTGDGVSPAGGGHLQNQGAIQYPHAAPPIRAGARAHTDTQPRPLHVTHWFSARTLRARVHLQGLYTAQPHDREMMNHPNFRRRRAPAVGGGDGGGRGVAASHRNRNLLTPLVVMLMTCRVAAHPTLIDNDVCGDAAHPTTKRHHAAPVHDGTISFLLSWAAPDGSATPQPDENQPKRRIPEVRNEKLPNFFWALHPCGRHTRCWG